jgi:hypothetical protein
MRRRIFGALAIAFFIAIAAGVTSQQVLAWSNCHANMSWGNSSTSVSASGIIYDVTFAERPAFMYVDWGDGTSYYQEWSQTGTVGFETGGHTYASPGNYTTYWTIGTLGDGESDCLGPGFAIPISPGV